MTNNPSFYLSTEQSCSYLTQQSTTIFLDPEFEPDMHFYQLLLENGFRRSGSHVYKPHCNTCNACLSVRIDIKAFLAKKSQRRCIKKNNDVNIQFHPAIFSQQHFQLYQQYLDYRHKNAGMDNPSPEQYEDFVFSNWCETECIELRLPQENNRLLAVAITDVLPNALSSVYTFFSCEPADQARSIGTYAILSQIEVAKQRELDWVYLGYWIKENAKMHYKDQFQPAEYFKNGKWLKF